MAILINDVSARIQYTATSGQTVFTVPFEFFENSDLKVYQGDTLLTITTHYTVVGAGVTGGGTVTLVTGATAGDTISIVRDVPVKRVTDFPVSGPFNINGLNEDLDRLTAMVQQQETRDSRTFRLADSDTPASLNTIPSKANRSGKVFAFDSNGQPVAENEIGEWKGNWAASTAYAKRDIVKDSSNSNVYRANTAHTSSGSTPISSNADAAKWDLVVDAAAAGASASAAAASAAAASTSETNAANSASNAFTYASAASVSAGAAASSASSASSAQSAAESARDATLAAYDNFDDRYLGPKSSAPTLDNDGNALIAGSLYFDTTTETMKVYTGSTWVTAYGPAMTAAEIKTSYESNADTNAFTDAEKSQLSGLFVTLAEHGGDGAAAAEAAYAAGVPLLVKDGETAYLTFDSNDGDSLPDMCSWASGCSVSSSGTLYIAVANGRHDVGTGTTNADYVYIDNGGKVDIRGSGSSFITVTGLSFANVASNLYECTVTLASTLPTGLAVGDPVGMFNIQGDGYAMSANGGQLIHSITGTLGVNATTFTFRFYSSMTPSGTPTLDNTAINGVTPNQLMLSNGWLVADDNGWLGSNIEGYFNVYNGSELILRNIGIGYNGAALSAHDLIAVFNEGSRLWLYDYVTLAGAGEKVVRQYGGSEVYTNRSCIGGAGRAKQVHAGQSSTQTQFIRTFMGGCSEDGITMGTGSGFTATQCVMGSADNGIYLNGAGAYGAWQSSQMGNCVNGAHTLVGELYLTSNKFYNCTTGLRYGANGSNAYSVSNTYPSCVDDEIRETVGTFTEINYEKDTDSYLNWKDTSGTTTGYIRHVYSNKGFIVANNNKTHMYLYPDGIFNTGTDTQSPYNYTTATAANVTVLSNGHLYRSTSSARYKTDIEDIQLSTAYDVVLKSRPVWYRSTTGNDRADWSYWGLIAEEVSAIDPRLVLWKTEDVTVDPATGDETVTPLDVPIEEGVQYDRYIPHLLAVIQDLEKRIKVLEGK